MVPSNCHIFPHGCNRAAKPTTKPRGSRPNALLFCAGSVKKKLGPCRPRIGPDRAAMLSGNFLEVQPSPVPSYCLASEAAEGLENGAALLCRDADAVFAPSNASRHPPAARHRRRSGAPCNIDSVAIRFWTSCPSGRIGVDIRQAWYSPRPGLADDSSRSVSTSERILLRPRALSAAARRLPYRHEESITHHARGALGDAPCEIDLFLSKWSGRGTFDESLPNQGPIGAAPSNREPGLANTVRRSALRDLTVLFGLLDDAFQHRWIVSALRSALLI